MDNLILHKFNRNSESVSKLISINQHYIQVANFLKNYSD